jgi:hypothetical protein
MAMKDGGNFDPGKCHAEKAGGFSCQCPNLLNLLLPLEINKRIENGLRRRGLLRILFNIQEWEICFSRTDSERRCV